MTIRHLEYPQVDERTIKALRKEHLRRSLTLRSLKFSHRLPQVSSRMAPCISGLRVFRATRCTAHGKYPESGGMTVMPIFTGFLRSRSAAYPQPQRQRIALRRACTPRNEIAHIRGRPDPAVPICRDRHNSATAHSPFSAGSGTISMFRRALDEGKTRGIAWRWSAEELGKRWRFFPTYADVQTSTVLRQPFLCHPRDNEC